MRHSEQRRSMHIELETQKCNLPFDELTRLQEPLDRVVEGVGSLPSDLKVSVVHHPASDRFHVSADLRLPRRSIFTGDWDPYLDTAAQRCLRKLIRKIEAYQHEPDRDGDRIAEQVRQSREQIVAPQDPDAGILAEAVRNHDYRRFRELLAGHDDWLRLRDRVANNVDVFDVLVSRTFKRQLHSRTARAANLVAHFEGRFSRHRHAVNFNNAIAVTQSGFGGRRTIESGGDIRVGLVAANVILDRGSNTEVFGTLISLQFVKLFAVVIIGMRIE